MHLEEIKEDMVKGHITELKNCIETAHAVYLSLFSHNISFSCGPKLKTKSDSEKEFEEIREVLLNVMLLSVLLVVRMVDMFEALIK